MSQLQREQRSAYNYGGKKPYVVDDLPMDDMDDSLIGIDDLELDPCDLSEWMDCQHKEGTDFGEVQENILEPEDIFNEGNFEDCKQMVDREAQRDYSRRRASRSPPRQRARKHSPLRTRQMNYRSPPARILASSSHVATVPVQSPVGDEVYNTAMNKLKSSMRKSELSRAQVLKHGESLSQAPKQPAPSTLGSLTGLLSGKRSALTAGLEQSRKNLRMYMMLLNSNQLM